MKFLVDGITKFTVKELFEQGGCTWCCSFKINNEIDSTCGWFYDDCQSFEDMQEVFEKWIEDMKKDGNCEKDIEVKFIEAYIIDSTGKKYYEADVQ